MKKLIIFYFLLIMPYAASIGFRSDLKTNPDSSDSNIPPVMPHAVIQFHVNDTYGKLSLSFEANQGQTDSEVKFLSRGRDYTLFLTSKEAVLSIADCGLQIAEEQRQQPQTAFRNPQSSVLRMKLFGANPSPLISGLEPLPGKSNYFSGSDPQKWHNDVPNYAKVEYKEVYSGIDLVYYGNQQQLEYDFIVAPGADPQAIKLAFEGVDKIEVDDRGNLRLHTASGEIRQHKPIVYQEVDDAKQPRSGSYMLTGEHEVGFQVGAYDANRPLVIDPVLSFSTYLGGSGHDFGGDIAVNANGNVYVTGTTRSADFPTASAFQAALDSIADVFVAKLNAAGDALVYSTYLGGSRQDTSNAITVDAAGNVYVAGRTDSEDFPTKNPARGKSRFSDGFVTKLNPAGNALIYSTYYGDNSIESYDDIAVDAAGNAYVIGNILVSIGTGGIDTDVLMGKLDATGSRSLYFLRFGLGGFDKGNAIAVDAAGNAYVAARIQTSSGLQIVSDAFVSKLTPNGDAVYGGRLPGSGDDAGNGVAIDAVGNAYVTGSTTSIDFITASPLQAANGGGRDAFVTKLNAAGIVVFSTYLGGSGSDEGRNLTLDTDGNVYVTGSTESANFPTASPLQAVNGGGGGDAFVAKINAATTTLIYSTYLGGSGGEGGSGVAVDAAGNAYVTGSTNSTNFPTTSPLQTANAGGNDIFIAKILSSPTSVKNDREQVPSVFALEQNYPNPFNPETEIRFQLSKPARAVLKIYNALGEEIRTLMDGTYRAGYHRVLWDGKDKNGNAVASGVYLYQLRADNFSQVRKMSLLR